LGNLRLYQRRKLFTFVVAQPHNIFLYGNFPRSQDRFRPSGRDESESWIPFKLVEANHQIPISSHNSWMGPRRPFA